MQFDAVRAAERAVAFEPYNTMYLTELARLYHDTKNPKARETIERALSINPDDIEALKLSEAI